MAAFRFGGLLLLSLLSCSALALTSQHDFLLDLDNDVATGCTVGTPDGAFAGVEVILSAEVETDGLDAAEVVTVTRSDCVDPDGNGFSAPTAIGGGWPVGVGEGVAGFHVIEVGFGLANEYRFADTRIGVSASNELGDSATLLDRGGSPIILQGLPPIPVPVATTLVLVVLALGLLALGLLVLGRRGRLTFTALVALLGAGGAGAGAVYSGLLADWGPDDLLAETSAADPDGGVEVRALFGQRAGGGMDLVLRLDSALVFAAVPQAVDDSYTTVLTTAIAENDVTGLLANDELGLPAAELAGFGGGDLGGSVGDNAAGDSVTVGADGSLTVHTDGSFEFQAATGFDGPFSFDYRIGNVAGSAQAQVTIEIQRPPAAEDDTFDMLAGETLDTGTGALLVNDTGWPDPAVSAFGGGDLGGSVDDHAAGDSVTVGSDGSLTIGTDGQVVFTPASGFSGEFGFDYRIDNPAGSDTASVIVSVNEAPTITSADAVNCAVGSACSFGFTAEGYPEPDITIDGTLPTGVSFDAASGSLSGTPEAGSGAAYTLVVTASNGIGDDAEQNFTLSVAEAPTITSADSLGCEVGEDCTFTFTADGYPDPAFSLPGLPAGLSLDSASGELTGQPDPGTGGEYALVLEASNSEGSDSQNITLTIGQAPQITSPAALTCQVGQACSFTLTAEGYPDPTFDVPGLPAGLTIDTVSGEITGTPEVGTGEVYALTATADNSVGSDSQAFELTINEAPAITSAASHTCQTGQACSFTFTADGHPAPNFSIAEPLPAGLSLDGASGQLGGTPAGDAGGVYTLTVTAANGIAPDADQTFTLTVEQPPQITSPATLTCEVGSACSFTATADGYPDPGFTLPGLPTGLSFDGSSGEIAGTADPGTGGVYALTLTASNGVAPDAVQNLELTVNEAPAITSAATHTCQTGQACSFTFTADGHPDPNFSIAEALPTGLSLDGASGQLSGAPAGDAGGVYTLSLTAANGIAPDANQTFTLTIEQPPEITSSAALTCEVGSVCSFTATADGYPDPGFTLPGLPAGLNFDGSSGEITGTADPGTGGVYALTLTASNGVAPDAVQSFELTVNEAPSITSVPATTCQTGQVCGFTFTADGYPEPSFSIAEALPAGVSLDSASGQLSGTPAAGTGGEYALTVEAANGIGLPAVQNFTLGIAEAPAITSTDSVTCEVGASCNFPFSATGYPDPMILVSGTLPAGMSFDAGTEMLVGTPAVGAGGVYTLDVSAINGFAPDAVQTFTLTVNEVPQAVDDPSGGIPVGSSPGSMPYHGSLDTTLVVNAASGVLSNDQLGYPQASIDSLTPTSNAGATVTLTEDGGFSYQPPAGFTGIDVFTYCLDNGEVAPLPCADVEVAVGERPSASDDTFGETLIGNTGIDTALSSGYSLFDLAGGDAISISLAGTSNGDAVVDSNTGTFNFDPAAGFNGTATLEFQVSNGFADTPTGTVSFTVDEMVWYYDNTATPGGDGRLSAPFDSLAGASAASVNDIHFVYAGGGDYSGGISLLDGQVLMGQQSAGLLSALLTPPVPVDSVLPPAGARPVIVNPGGAGVNLASNNTLTGFDIGTTSGFGLSGSNFGTLTIDDVSITGSGPGLSLQTGTVTGSGFDQVIATSGSNGISLVDVGGNVALGTGSVSGATIAALEVNGGSADVSFGGSLQPEPGSGGRPVRVVNKTGGLVELTGPVSSTALGLRVADNVGSTLRLAGGLDLATGTHSAFEASQGGIVEVCDDNPCDPAVVGSLVNTLSTTTAVALDVENTTIGSNNLEFRSVSAGTAASGPTSGIVVMNTGSDGGLKVRGTGSAASGGTIRNATDSGVVLVDTGNVALADMTITGSATHGIDGTSVAGFELVAADVTGNGDAVNEEGLNFVNLSGAVSLVDVNATGNAYHNLRIDNDSGTISMLAISGGSFSSNDPAIGNHGVLITPRGSAVIDAASFDGVTLSDNRSMGMQVVTSDSAVINAFVVANSTFSDNELGLDFSKSQQSSIGFDIDGNQFLGQNSHGLNVFTAAGAGTTGSLGGLIRNNTVGQSGIDGSGSVIGNCMRVNINGDTDAAVRVENNILRECPNGRGLEVIGRNGTGGLDISVVDNDIDHVNLGFDPGTSDFPLAAIMVQSNCVTTCNTVRSDVRGNTVPTGSAFDFTSGFITLAQSSTSTLQLVDTPSGSADCGAQLTDNNTGSVGVAGACTLIPGPIDSP